MLLLDAYCFKGLPVLLKSDAGKKIYGKFMNIADETAQAWLQGVVDLVEILHIDIQAYLDCDKYKARCNNNDWILHPLPLLTAVGNGLGGGDYYGINKDQVGGWAWCTISVEDDIPVGYEELEYIFRED